MKIAHCDKHPDREAVVTISIKVHRVGFRPIFIGFETPPWHYYDLCDECRNSLSNLNVITTVPSQELVET